MSEILLKTPSPLSRSTLVAGFGSLHGADTLGWQVLDGLAETPIAEVTLRKYRHPSAVVGELAAFDRVIFVDALRSREHPLGTVVVLKAEDLPASNGVLSSHAQGLNDAIALASVLGVLPAQAQVLGCNVLGREEEPVPASTVSQLVERVLSCFD